MHFHRHRVSLLVAATALVLASSPSAAADAGAAKSLAKENDCFKCHAIDKTKKGPSYKKIAAKYKEKKLGEKEAIKQMTEGKKVKLEDGTEEEHKALDPSEKAEIDNIIQWVKSH